MGFHKDYVWGGDPADMFAPDLLSSQTFTQYKRPEDTFFKDILTEYQIGATDIGNATTGCVSWWLNQVAYPPVDTPVASQAGCQQGDKAVYTPAVEGTIIKFRASDPSVAACSDPLVLQATGCTPYVEQYGMHLGDGTSRDIEAIVDYVSPDDEPSANFLTLYGTFDHEYNSPAPRVAFFTGGERASDPASEDYVVNVPGGRFRLETTVTLSVDNHSPVVLARPVIPVPIYNTARDTSRLSTQTSFHIAAYDPDGTAVSFTIPSGANAARLLGGVSNYHSPLMNNDTNLASINTPAQPGGGLSGFLSVEAQSGLVTMTNPDTLGPGMYSLVLQVTDGSAVVSADVSIYLYHQLFFCHADCYRNNSGIPTPANPGGWYGDFFETEHRCSICSYGALSTEANCLPKYVSTIDGEPGCEQTPSAPDCEPSGCPGVALPGPPPPPP
eukprot:scaffold556958_cov43-Prasinocladus_malaysianus.AAC.1